MCPGRCDAWRPLGSASPRRRTSQPTQGGVTLSSSEAEFVAASQAGQEVLYLRALLKGFAYLEHGPTEIWEDNASCILMSENPTNRERSRHVGTFLTRHGARWIRETHQMRGYTKRR